MFLLFSNDMCRISFNSYLNFCIQKSGMSATKFSQSLIFSAIIPHCYRNFSHVCHLVMQVLTSLIKLLITTCNLILIKLAELKKDMIWLKFENKCIKVEINWLWHHWNLPSSLLVLLKWGRRLLYHLSPVEDYTHSFWPWFYMTHEFGIPRKYYHPQENHKILIILDKHLWQASRAIISLGI